MTELDRIAEQEELTTRSDLIARVMRQWIRARKSGKRINSVTVVLDDGTEYTLKS